MSPNYKIKKLETEIKQEMGKLLPVNVLPDGSITYKKYRIVKVNNFFELRYLRTNDFIISLRTKSAALLAAKFYDSDNFVRYNEVLGLDSKYYTNYIDSEIFKFRTKTSKDLDKKDLMQWRLEVSEHRARSYKDEISRLFKTYF